MTKNTVIDFAGPFARSIDFSPDPLTDVLRAGACELLTRAVRAEVSGFLPEREVMTGTGEVPVQVPVCEALASLAGPDAEGLSAPAITRLKPAWWDEYEAWRNARPMHEKARGGLQGIWMAETRKEATAAFGLFVETCGVRYERAVKKLTRDRDLLLMFCDYPPDTGNTSGRQTQSKAPSPPSGSAENAPKGVSAAKQPWPWPSN